VGAKHGDGSLAPDSTSMWMGGRAWRHRAEASSSVRTSCRVVCILNFILYFDMESGFGLVHCHCCGIKKAARVANCKNCDKNFCNSCKMVSLFFLLAIALFACLISASGTYDD
jgi:hypothetical protein